MQRFIAWFVNTFWICAAALIISVALLVSLGRYYLPLIDSFKPRVNEQVGELLDATVSTSELLATWDDTNPVVGVQGLKVFKASDNESVLMLLSLTEAHIELDVLESIRGLVPVYRQAFIEGLQFHLYKNKEGQWSSPLMNRGNNGVDFKALYQAVDDLRVVNSQLVFHEKDQVNIVEIKQLSLQSGKDLKQTLLQIVDSINQKPLDVVIETIGHVKSDQFSLKGYIDVDTLNLSPYRFLFPDNPVQSDQVDVKVWFDWGVGEPFKLLGKIAAQELSVRTLPLGNIKSQFGLLFENQEAKLFSNDFEVQLNDKNVVLPNFRLDIGFDFKTFKLSADQLDLRLLEQLSSAFPETSQHVIEAIDKLKPQGTLNNIVVNFSRNIKGWAPVFKADATEVSVDSWRGAPAIFKASGVITHFNDSGWFEFNKVPIRLGLYKLYDQDLLLEDSSGRIGWHFGERVTVAGLNLKGRGDYGDVHGQFVYDGRLNSEKGLTPSISLALNLDNGTADAIDHYVPDFNVDQQFRRWLRSANIKGDLPASQLFINTSTSTEKSWWPAMQLLARGQQMSMNFDLAWPRVKDANLSLLLSHRQTVGLVNQGQLYNSFLSGTVINIDTAVPGVDLSVTSSAAGSTADVIKLFQKTPLADSINHGFDGWSSQGDYRASLALHGQISALEHLSVDIYSTVDDADLVFDEADLRFAELKGSIRYKDGFIESEGGQALLWGEPWVIELLSQARSSGFDYQINAKGKVQADALAAWLAQPLLAFTEGEFYTEATFNFTDSSPKLDLYTDLQGLSIKAPVPAFKLAADKLDLFASIVFDEVPVLDVSTSLFKMLLSIEDKARAHVLLGNSVKSPYRLPEKDFLISGSFDKLVADDWADVPEQYLLFSERYPSGESADIIIDHFTVQQLLIGDSYINQFVASGFSTGSDWTIDVNAVELGGRLFWPDTKPIELDITHMMLPLPLLDDDEISFPPEPLLPSELLAANVRIDSLSIDGQAYGNWQFTVRPSANNAKIENIFGQFNNITIAGSEEGRGADLLWTQNEVGMQTNINFVATTTNVKNIFASYGLEPMLTSESARLQAQLFWSDEPLNWETDLFNGSLNIALEDGQFLRTEGAPTGLLKLLGVFNFDYLARRMRLDFGDLVKEGLSYDDLHADVVLEPGLILLPTPMHVKGPSSDFSLSGYIDLDKQTIDGDLTAVVPVSRNLPWVAAIAGGLPAAAGVYVASKVFSGGFDRLSSAQYSIKGPIDEPKIKFQRLFNDKNKVSPKSKDTKGEEELVSDQGETEVIAQ